MTVDFTPKAFRRRSATGNDPELPNPIPMPRVEPQSPTLDLVATLKTSCPGP